MSKHPVEITLTPTGPGSVVSVDGKPIQDMLSGFRLEASARYGHTLELGLELHSVPVDLQIGEATVTLEPEVHNFLVRLGWTPPETPQ